MELHGTRFGAIEYEQTDLIILSEGLIGMPSCTRFLILDFMEDLPFKWMQSVDDPTLGFIVSDPTLFRADFDLALAAQDLKGIDVSEPDELAVFVICTYRGDWDSLTANLMGPIIVHVSARSGRQIIFEDAAYTTHEQLPQALLKGEAQTADANGARGTESGPEMAKPAAADLLEKIG